MFAGTRLPYTPQKKNQKKACHLFRDSINAANSRPKNKKSVDASLPF
jgi:hypothetical protein